MLVLAESAQLMLGERRAFRLYRYRHADVPAAGEHHDVEAIFRHIDSAKREHRHLRTASLLMPRIITMVVPFPAGGPTDAIARGLADKRLAWTADLIEAFSGADGSIGTRLAARARPDGYTIELGSTSSHMLNRALYSLPYDVLKSFAPISPLASLPIVLVTRKTMPANDLNELIDWLKINSDKTSAGVGTSSLRLIIAFFQKETGTQFTLVPSRLLCGTVDVALGSKTAVAAARPAPPQYLRQLTTLCTAQVGSSGPATDIFPDVLPSF